MTPNAPSSSLPPLLVCGNANVETVWQLGAEDLPPHGASVTGGLSLNVSGVGVNLARALTRLGSRARLLAFLGDDAAGRLVRQELGALGDALELRALPAPATPQTLALVRPGGQHRFYRDVKDIPEQPAPSTEFLRALDGCAAALMTNIGWTRELLPHARARGVPVQTDVQDISRLDNPYDQPYFEAADVLFLSAERLSNPGDTLRALARRRPARVLVAGLGEEGALLLERGDDLKHQPAFRVQALHRGGAGDALSASFAHFYFTRRLGATEALRLACAAAALKLRGEGSGVGHATEAEVRALAGLG